MNRVKKKRRRAVELMTLGGMMAKDAARIVGLHPMTVHRWMSRDAEFRREVEAWRAGPGLDEATLAQARRIIIDELARRVLHEREKMSLRDLLNVHDRLIEESPQNTEKEDEDEETESQARSIELTPEQVERIWAEIEQGVGRPPENAPEHETKP